MEELKSPQEYEDGNNFTLDVLNEKETNIPRIQAMFTRSRDINISMFILSQDYYELSKKSIRTNENIYHVFKPNYYSDVKIFVKTKQTWI